MKILMITDVFFPRINGVSTSINTFRQFLKNSGHEVHLICPEYNVATNNTDDSYIYRIPSIAVPIDPEDRLMKTRFIWKLLEHLRRQQFDIIHIQTPFYAHRTGVRLAVALGIPVVETYHTYFEEYFYHYVKFLPKKVLRFAARRLTRNQSQQLDAMIVPSRAMLTVLQEYGVKTPIHIIPTGLDLETFKNGDGFRFRDVHNISHHRRVMVHIGRVAYEKNIDFLLYVLQEIKNDMPDILLVIAGEGPAKQHLQELAKKLQLEDETLFVGYLSRESDLLDCYKAGDIFVFSSQTETQGLVLLEAMALSVPVVSIAEMGTKDILEPGKGCLVASNNVDDFASKALSVLRSQVLRSELAREAKAYAATWSIGLMTQRIVDCYDNCIESYAQMAQRSSNYAIEENT